MINSQYVLSSKHTLYERFMYQKDPEVETFNCFILPGNCNPGAPVNAFYGNHVASLELQSVLTPNFVNQARVSYHRDVENNTDPNVSSEFLLASQWWDHHSARVQRGRVRLDPAALGQAIPGNAGSSAA